MLNPTHFIEQWHGGADIAPNRIENMSDFNHEQYPHLIFICIFKIKLKCTA